MSQTRAGGGPTFASMYRIWVSGSLLAIAIAIAAIGATGANAFEGGMSPQVPGIGNAHGIGGPGPQVEVFGGRSGLREGTTAWVEVRCTTSTGTGCSGTLELLAGNTRVASTQFELVEGQSQGVHARLARDARRKARRRSGLELLARACATDSLSRSDCGEDSVTVRRSARPPRPRA